MKVKVCGMKEPGNIAQVAALGPDYMGFIFYAPSPRFAGRLDPISLEVLSPRTRRVGVFVDASETYIRETAEKYALDMVQLHGAESPGKCRRLSEDICVIKAFGISEAADLGRVAEYEGACGMYVFDTKTPSHGGSGLKFDHHLLAAYTGATPYLLSGGLGVGDAEVLAGFADPRCVGFDINSRFESAPGIKDAAAVKKFMEIIKKS